MAALTLLRRLALMLPIWAALIFGALLVGQALPSRQMVYQAYNRQRAQDDSPIMLLDVWRGISVRITQNTRAGFALSPQGMLAFSGEGTSIFTIDVYGENRRVYADNGPGEPSWMAASWSPDGAALAFIAPNRSEIRISDGATTYTVSNFSYDVSGVEWSPDGARLVFTDYSTPTSTSTIRVIDLNRGTDYAVSPAGKSAFFPDWSPDGARITFSASGEGNRGDIYVVNVDGSGLQNLTHSTTDEHSPQWSNDGTRIAYISEDIIGIYIVNVDGTNAHPLVTQEGFYAYLAWSPDSAALAFMFRPAEMMGQVYIIDANGGEMVRVSVGEMGAHPLWLP